MQPNKSLTLRLSEALVALHF